MQQLLDLLAREKQALKQAERPAQKSISIARSEERDRDDGWDL